MTDQTDSPAPTDPNRRRRAVIRVHEELIHDLLQLPPDIEVRAFALDMLRNTIDIMVTSPDLTPAYVKIYDRPVLVDTGISHVPNAATWEWNYRYPDTGPTAFNPITEADARLAAAKDLSVILLRRQPGETEWTEAPA